MHHILPRQFRFHPALNGMVDLEADANLVLMPTRRGKAVLNIRPDRLVHEGGHNEYNKFVKRYLDAVQYLPKAQRMRHVQTTQLLLRDQMRRPTFVAWG